MYRWTQSTLYAAALAATLTSVSTPAQAGIGDLLVAPTRIVLDGRKGAEIILNNIGEEPATYRVSVEFRRMTPDGGLVDVAQPTADDQKAADMVVYAPRKVVLAPHQPQAIRIAARPPQGLPDGEYRVHLLFRAIPPATPVVQAAATEPVKGLRFQLTPVYGVTIPVIVRLGNLQATAAIANVHLEQKDGKPFVSLDLSRSGDRSTFGEVIVETYVHNLDAINWFLGSTPLKAIGTGGRTVEKRGDLLDHLSVTYDYPRSVQMTFVGSQMTPRYFRSNRERYIGESGFLETTRESWTYNTGSGPVTEKSEHDITIDALQEFVRRVAEGKPENVGIRAAESTLTAILGQMAIDRKREVTWDEMMKSA